MRFFTTTGLFCYCLAIFGPAQEPDYQPDTIALLQTEHFEKPLHVWLPRNYDPAKKWPVLFYYHGTNGQPSVEYLRMYSDSENWVLVGMTYLQPGQFQYSEESLKATQKILYEVRDEIAKEMNLDFQKTYVGGFSKGGWVSGLLLQTDTELAGGLILGAGTFTDGITDHPKKLFIGIGENDPNLAMSHRARREFSANQATDITFEIWNGIGHKFPLNEFTLISEPMKQWLRVEAGAADQGDAIEWMEDKLATTKKNPELSEFQKLEIFEAMQRSPYAKLLDREGIETLAETITEFQALPATVAEQQARTAFFKVIEYESKDRLVSTLAECNAQYSKIATKFPETEYGKWAKKAVTRISRTLGALE